ncbi:hypothetical protein SAMD00023353_2400980 [Rosellinia necatrix]|uniref:Uncharacterized protein n=1 Tax=Rosellinia necatrix TaxID=77044 RepID=A0A1W2TFU5_ROSNE|nr:hypothetical protein SAMD00023353_2400980 [Rosellinia necatrix]
MMRYDPNVVADPPEPTEGNWNALFGGSNDAIDPDLTDEDATAATGQPTTDSAFPCGGGGHSQGISSSAPHGSSPHGVASHDSAPHDTAPHDSSSHGVAPHDSAPHDSAPHDAALHDSSSHGVAPHDAAPHDAAPHDAAPHNVAPRGITFRGGRGGRGGSSRAGKRAAARISGDSDTDSDDVFVDAPKKRAKRRSKATTAAAVREPEIHPVEIHRRRTSLRDRLIKGEYAPQAVGMRVFNMNKAAAAAAAARAANTAAAASSAPGQPQGFAVPAVPPQRSQFMPSDPSNANANANVNVNAAANNNNNNNNDDNVEHMTAQPNTHTAFKSTPLRQLYFPTDLARAIQQRQQQDISAAHDDDANANANANGGAMIAFVVARLVGADVAGVRVFRSARDATADALRTMATEHPEAFSARNNNNNSGYGDVDYLAPVEEPAVRATSLIRDIAVPPPPRRAEEDGSVVEGLHGADMEEPLESLFVEQHDDDDHDAGHRDMYRRRHYFSTAAAAAAAAATAMMPPPEEPVYVFCGTYRISPTGMLALEARRQDGAAVRVAVYAELVRGAGPA